MINIVICEDKKFYNIRAEGHACYAEIGKDIVCAGVTSLFYAFKNALESEKYCKCKFESGGFAVKCKRNKRTADYIKMLKCGLYHIYTNYPENISLSVRK